MEKVNATILQKLAQTLNFRHINKSIKFKLLKPIESNVPMPMTKL